MSISSLVIFLSTFNLTSTHPLQCLLESKNTFWTLSKSKDFPPQRMVKRTFSSKKAAYSMARLYRLSRVQKIKKSLKSTMRKNSTNEKMVKRFVCTANPFILSHTNFCCGCFKKKIIVFSTTFRILKK